MPSLPVPEPVIVRTLRAAGCVFAEEEAWLLTQAAQTPRQLEAMVGRRASGLPLEHILGWVEFCGIRIAVDPGVFVPRRRTEFLVRQAARFLAPSDGARPAPVVVDLCCGSGAVGAALLPLGGEVHEGDLFTPIPARLRGTVLVLAVNAPYVPSAAIGTMPPEARLHEPRASLDGGADGLDVQRRVAAAAPQWLAPGGRLLIETSRGQAPRTAELFRRSGLTARVLHSGKLDATVVAGGIRGAG
jgi:release factor glutamine methyltransferase